MINRINKTKRVLTISIFMLAIGLLSPSVYAQTGSGYYTAYYEGENCTSMSDCVAESVYFPYI